MITVRDVARRMGRNPETVRRWIWEGKLPARKIGNQLFVEEADLATMVGRSTVVDALDQVSLVEELRRFHRALRDQGIVPVGSAVDLIHGMRGEDAGRDGAGRT